MTLQLKNVTVDEVLQLLQNTHDIDVRQQGNIFYVSGSEIQTAIYPLNYLNLKRKGNSQTRVSSGQIFQGNSQQNSNSGGNNNGQNNNSGGGANITTLNSTRIETESSADLWVEVQQTLQTIVEQDKNGQAIVSPQTGIVIVKASPMIQRQVSEYLGIAQANLSRQVILEAKILEVTLNDSFQAGIDWSKIKISGAGEFYMLDQAGQILQEEGSSFPMNGNLNFLYLTDPNDPDPFYAAIRLLKDQGDVQVLSSPRVSTINNQKAVIKVGTDEFFVTDVSTTTVSGINSSTTPDLTLTPFFSGIALDVTPHISATGDIILHIHPSVSEIEDQTKVVTIGNDDFTFPLALSSVRESDSIVKTRNGHVVIIGGLMQDKSVEIESGAPGLINIPILGHLFKQQRKMNRKSELIILLKATVIDNDDWQHQLKDSESGFRKLGS